MDHRAAQGKLEYATASEAEYTPDFCAKYAACVLATLPPLPARKSSPSIFDSGPRRQSHRPLVPEFRAVVNVQEPPPTTGQYRILSSSAGEIDQDKDAEVPPDIRANQKPDRGSHNQQYKVGIRWDPLEFFQEAKNVTHPCDPQAALPQVLKTAIRNVLTSDPASLARSRLEAVLTMKKIAGELAEAEADLKKRMDPTVAKILKDKNLCLWKALLQASNYGDVAIVDSIAAGIDLVGSHGEVEAMHEDLRPAEISPKDLLESAPLRRKIMQSQIKEHSSEEQGDLDRTSREEVELGDLQGPFSEAEVSEFFESEEWLLNPRFPIYQGEAMKVRIIDDCKMSGMNSAFQRTFGIKLMDIDVLAATAASIAKAIADGSVDGAPLHPKARQCWLGGTLDLSRAYKQVPLSPDSRRFCVLGFIKDGVWTYYRSEVLPFGASASVFSFIRISRSIHHILCSFLSAIATVFFDDYPMMTTEAGSDILKLSVSSVLTMLGWKHAKHGKKMLNFAQTFTALGAEVDLSSICLGNFKLRNKEGRVPKLINFLSRVEDKGYFAPGETSILQGHLNFASGFYLSKGLKFLNKSLSAVARDKSNKEQLKAFCRMAKHLLSVTPDKEFKATDPRKPILVFSDGAFEGGVATAGAVIFDPNTSRTWVCDIPVPDRLRDLWLKDAGKQIISQVEAWAMLAVRFEFRHTLRNRPAIGWVDNESARLALVKGTSDSQSLRSMARLYHLIETSHPAMMWLERVASFSNPGDGPSRGQASVLAASLQASLVESFDQTWLIEALLKLGAHPYYIMEPP